MRFALILAFVSSVFFNTDAGAAPRGADRVVAARKPSKVHKRRAARSVAKAKVSSKRSKTHKAKAKPEPKPEEVADTEQTDESDAPAPTPTLDALPAPKGAPVSQATDDEEPPAGPKKH